MRKIAIAASIGMNVALASVFVLRVAPPRQSSTVANPSRDVTPAPPLQEEPAPAPKPASVAPETDAFRWSRIESGDLREYVANLRSIGCPERTLRAIVTADLDTRYQEHARELEARLAEFQKAPLAERLSSFSAIQALQDQLQQLSDLESAEISNLLESPAESTAPNPLQASAAPASTINRSVRAPAPPQMPLVLQNVNYSSLNLNSEQRQIVEDLRQSFIDLVGGPNQDPNDPAYLQRWQKAQPLIDDDLRGLLGVTVLEEFEMAIQPPQISPARNQ